GHAEILLHLLHGVALEGLGKGDIGLHEGLHSHLVHLIGIGNHILHGGDLISLSGDDVLLIGVLIHLIGRQILTLISLIRIHKVYIGLLLVWIHSLSPMTLLSLSLRSKNSFFLFFLFYLFFFLAFK